MPKVDLPDFSVLQGFSAEALGLTKSMEAALGPMSHQLSSLAFEQLESVRREAAAAIKAFEGAMPKVDLPDFSSPHTFPTDALFSLLESDTLAQGRELFQSLQARPLLERSIHEIVGARELWERIDLEIESVESLADLTSESTTSKAFAILATVATLVAVEAGASRVLLDLAVFALEAVVGLIQLAWQVASLPEISAPMSTFGAVAGILALALYLRDRSPSVSPTAQY